MVRTDDHSFFILHEINAPIKDASTMNNETDNQQRSHKLITVA